MSSWFIFLWRHIESHFSLPLLLHLLVGCHSSVSLTSFLPCSFLWLYANVTLSLSSSLPSFSSLGFIPKPSLSLCPFLFISGSRSLSLSLSLGLCPLPHVLLSFWVTILHFPNSYTHPTLTPADPCSPLSLHRYSFLLPSPSAFTSMLPAVFGPMPSATASSDPGG